MNLPPDETIELGIVSSPAHLPVVRAAMEKTCELMGFDAETAGGVVLSVDEALTNIIKHAYNGAPDKPITIQLTPFDNASGQGLRIRVRDHGPAVRPDKIKSRDLADVRPGGLGVHIMNECMDKVEFQPADGGGTLLTMIKTLPSRSRITKR